MQMIVVAEGDQVNKNIDGKGKNVSGENGDQLNQKESQIKLEY